MGLDQAALARALSREGRSVCACRAPISNWVTSVTPAPAPATAEEHGQKMLDPSAAIPSFF